ncbi:hypothetical protein PO909_016939 [Leuciscus waleckii]
MRVAPPPPPPPRSRAVNTSFHGARLSSVPSGDRSANPATSGVTGRSGLRRAHISRSTRKRSGLGMPAPSEEGVRAVCSVVPCRCAVTGRQTDYSTAIQSRNQSREAGTSSRIFDNVEATVKCFSLGFMGVLPTVVGPEQVLVMEQEVNTLLEKGAIEYVPPSNRETGFYSRYFIVPKKDGGLRPILDLRVLNEDHFFRRGLGFSVDAGAPVTATCRFHPCSCEKCKARPATHCQTVPETVGSSGESSQGPRLPASYSPALAGQSMVSRSCVPPRRASSGATRQEGPSVPSRGLDFSPPTGTVEPVGLASEGAQLIESGLSTEVVETILQSRAPSTRKLYALKWRVFTSWCSDRRLDPVNCPFGTVLEFLQDRFTAGLTPSTLKVYVAAIGAYHIPLGGMSVGRHPLLARFIRGARRLRPPVRTKIPSWDLAIVLEGLVETPFEPLESASDKLLTLKMFFLMALTSYRG